MVGLSEATFEVVGELYDLESGGEHCEGVRCYTPGDPIIGIGQGLHRGVRHLLDATISIGRTFTRLARCAWRPARMRLPAIVANMQRAGVNAILSSPCSRSSSPSSWRIRARISSRASAPRSSR